MAVTAETARDASLCVLCGDRLSAVSSRRSAPLRSVSVSRATCRSRPQPKLQGMNTGMLRTSLCACVFFPFKAQRGKAGGEVLGKYLGLERGGSGRYLGLERRVGGRYLGLEREGGGRYLGLEREGGGRYLRLEREGLGRYLGLEREGWGRFLGLEREGWRGIWD